MLTFELFTFWGFAMLAGLIAWPHGLAWKNRDTSFWGFVGFFFPPALVFLLVLPRGPGRPRPSSPGTSTTSAMTIVTIPGIDAGGSWHSVSLTPVSACYRLSPTSSRGCSHQKTASATPISAAIRAKANPQAKGEAPPAASSVQPTAKGPTKPPA